MAPHSPDTEKIAGNVLPTSMVPVSFDPFFVV